MSINVNDEVKVVSNNGGDSAMMIGCTGKVIRLYDLFTPIAIVKFNNGITAKIPVNDLIKVDTQVNQENKIPEGAKRITKDEMRAALMTVTSPDHMVGSRGGKVDPMELISGGLACMLTGSRIIEELYEDKDEIVITEDQFIQALVKGTTVEKLSQDVGGRMDPIALMPIGLLCALVLKGMIPIIFGDGSSNA